MKHSYFVVEIIIELLKLINVVLVIEILNNFVYVLVQDLLGLEGQQLLTCTFNTKSFLYS